MIVRRDSLAQALEQIEQQALTGASIIIVSRSWWEALSPAEQGSYRSRAEKAGVQLRADENISRHFVEIRGGPEGPPLSSEHPM